MGESFLGIIKTTPVEDCFFLHVSDGFLQTTGYSLKELTDCFDNSLWKMLPEEDRTRLHHEISHLEPSQRDFVLSFRIRSKNGKILWLNDQISIYEEQGERCAFHSLSQTARVHVFAPSSRYVTDLLPVPVFIVSPDKKLLYLNSAASKLFKVNPAQCLGEPCSLLALDSCGKKGCLIDRYLQGEPVSLVEDCHGHSLRLAVSVLSDENAEPEAYICSCADITELRNTERLLRESEERYRILLSGSNNCLWECDLRTGLFLPFENNISWCPIVGFDGGPVEGAPESLIERGSVYPDSAEDMLVMFQKIREGEKTAGCTLQFRTKNGGSKWMEIACAAAYGPDGTPERLIGTARDVSATKEIEQQYLQERRYRESFVSEAIYAYEVNLTQDCLVRVESEWTKVLDISDSIGYEELVQAAKEKAVHPRHRERMAHTMNRSALLDAFAAGKREIRVEYMRLDPNDRMIWVECFAHLIKTPGSNDICAFIQIKDINDEKLRELELQKKAEQDFLTGIYNRNASLSLIEDYLEEANSQPDELSALFMLDVDDFKRINDTYGHTRGDDVLIELAKRLSSIFRREDVVGRLGGDEFIVFLRNIPNEQAALSKAEQICRTLRSAFTGEEWGQEISGSVGIAFAPWHGRRFQELYEKADTALYHAKGRGKNRFAVYSDDMTMRAELGGTD